MSFRAYYALQETKRGVQFTGMIFQTRSGKDRFVIVKISGGPSCGGKKLPVRSPPQTEYPAMPDTFLCDRKDEFSFKIKENLLAITPGRRKRCFTGSPPQAVNPVNSGPFIML